MSSLIQYASQSVSTVLFSAPPAVVCSAWNQFNQVGATAPKALFWLTVIKEHVLDHLNAQFDLYHDYDSQERGIKAMLAKPAPYYFALESLSQMSKALYNTKCAPYISADQTPQLDAKVTQLIEDLKQARFQSVKDFIDQKKDHKVVKLASSLIEIDPRNSGEVTLKLIPLINHFYNDHYQINNIRDTKHLINILREICNQESDTPIVNELMKRIIHFLKA